MKYPRTFHLPWSENINNDDRMLSSTEQFKGRKVILTEKLDGENTTMYKDYIHARSMDGRSHVSRDWVKQFHSKIAHDIPEGWRICGENLFAKHSIYYDNLSSYFYGFSVWNEKNVCLSWKESLDWFNLLGIIPVPLLYYGDYDEAGFRKIKLNWDICEGYVLRVVDEIPYSQWRNLAGKYVRKNHIQTVKHWMYGQRLEMNHLKEKENG